MQTVCLAQLAIEMVTYEKEHININVISSKAAVTST